MKKVIAICVLLLVVGGEVALTETSLVGEPITVAATSDANSATQPKHRHTRRHARRRRHNRRRR